MNHQIWICIKTQIDFQPTQPKSVGVPLKAAQGQRCYCQKQYFSRFVSILCLLAVLDFNQLSLFPSLFIFFLCPDYQMKTISTTPSSLIVGIGFEVITVLRHRILVFSQTQHSLCGPCVRFSPDSNFPRTESR